ncbi:helix-turn-helix domain-containing protein [uncultured Sphaerotilus sp.]|uniref:Crp/Fnr family transcriptional regulator n=1 Tax=uncultured Sphaerotilus sp. TaxID=474984 RepID=UPI0030CA1961
MPAPTLVSLVSGLYPALADSPPPGWEQDLAALLGRGPVLHITHQQLADELGTVREMVTRLLKRFEQAGWVALGRERVQLLDAVALRAAASQATEVQRLSR